MPPARIAPEQLVDHLPERGLVWLQGCSAESGLFKRGLAGRHLPGLTFTGILVPGLNRVGYVLDTGARFTSFFMTPELAAAPAQVDFLPLCYRDIRAFLAANPPDTLLLMLAPPDENGLCSFGPVTDFAVDLWQGATRIIAHINPNLPPTHGTPGIPYDRLTAVIDGAQDLAESDPGTDEIAQTIAAFAAPLILDGATIQAGLGRIPEAVLRGLTGKKNLAIHSGLIGDSTLNLLQAGALRQDTPITAGVAIGTRRLYDALGDPAFRFKPPSYTHEIAIAGQLPAFVTINSAIEVDLNGCAYAEATPRGLMSGPGGASDFAAAARGPDGLRLVVMQATAAKGAISKIVAPGSATGPVSLGRMDTDMVITEYGVADLRLKSHADRKAALIAVAAPDHRAALTESKTN